MKAINTHYNGHVFRSRLEARWAVAFDHCGYKWDYEPEGFELEGVGRYLPDFLIWGGTCYQMWAEVKPTAPTLEELRKARALAFESKIPVALLVGKPQRALYWAVTENPSDCPVVFDLLDGDEGEVIHATATSLLWSFCDHTPLVLPSWTAGEYKSTFKRACHKFPMPDSEVGAVEFNEDAINAANSARFEFGHSGSAISIAA